MHADKNDDTYALSGSRLAKSGFAATTLALTLSLGACGIAEDQSSKECLQDDDCNSPGTVCVEYHCALASFDLQVDLLGDGTGQVQSTPSGIDCGSGCKADFEFSTSVKLTAAADATAVFTGWSGDCSGTGDCTVVMTSSRSVSATFVKNQGCVVSKVGAGQGSVESMPPGLECDEACAMAMATFRSDVQVTLTATPAADSDFLGWGGDCTGTGECSFVPDDDCMITANFRPQYQLQLTPSPDTLTIVEGRTATITAVLTQPPNGTVTVTFAADAALVVTPPSVTFDAGNFDMPVEVHLRAEHDDDVEDDAPRMTVTTTRRGAVGYTVTVTDDDRLAIDVSGPVMVPEGDSVMVPVRLTKAPPATTTILIGSRSPNAAAVTPSALSFDSTDWQTSKFITVRGIEDDDVEDATGIVRLESPQIPNSLVDLAIVVTDPDRLEFVLSRSAVTVGEGGATRVAVQLLHRPTADVVVMVESMDAEAASVTPMTLTFDSMSWNSDQEIEITGVPDDDVGMEMTGVTLSATGLPIATVAVTVTDDDVQRIVASTTNVTVDEGMTEAVNVALAYQPTGVVIVAVESGAPGLASATPATLTFDAATWSVAQTVTISGEQDVDLADGNTSVTLSSLGLNGVAIAIEVRDDDEQRLVLSVTEATLVEQDTVAVDVSLMFQPSGPVFVTVTPPALGLSVDVVNLTFNASNYAIPQTIVVTAIDDDDTVGGTFNVQVSAPGVSSSLAVTVVDPDVQAIFVPESTTVSMPEGTTLPIGVRLAFRPQGNVDVFAVSLDGAVVTATPPALTFTPQDWSTPQSVVLTAVEDADTVPGATSVNLTGPSVPVLPISVAVIDDDTQAIVTSVTQLGITEGASQFVDVNLAFMPQADVVVALVSPDTTAVQVQPATLRFTPANYGARQQMTVEAVQDVDAAREIVPVTLTSVGIPMATVTVTTTDDEDQGLSVSPTNVTTTEGGASAQVLVRLTQPPAGPLTVSVTSADELAATVSPATLTFDATTWETPQAVTVTPVSDLDTAHESVRVTISAPNLDPVIVTVGVTDDDVQDIVLDTESVQVAEGGSVDVVVNLTFDPVTPVTLTFVSSDPAAVVVSPATLTFNQSNYLAPRTVTLAGAHDFDLRDESVTVSVSGAAATSRMIAVAVIDEDQQAIVADTATVAIDEGTSATRNVRLAFEPESPIAVDVQSSEVGVTISRTTMTFTSTNYATPVGLVVGAIDDDDTEDLAADVTLSSTGLGSVVIPVRVVDPDVQAIVAPTSLNVVEDGSAQVSLRLRFRPASTVTVAVTSTDPTVATASPASLTFTSANYATPQVVTVSGADDDDTLDESATLRLSTAGVPDALVAINVADPDEQALELSRNVVTLSENATEVATIRLAFRPQNAVTVNVSSSDSMSASVVPTTLTFEPAVFDVPQNITITGIDDVDTQDDVATVFVRSAGLSDAAISVTVTDPDDPTISVSSMTPTVGEGSSTTVDVWLAYRPAAPVTVAVASSNPALATASPATLTFDPMSYATRQSITLMGTQDLDTEDESVTVTLSASGYPSVALSTTVQDDDVQRVSLGTTSLSITEGATGQFAVSLTQIPSGNVTFDVTSDAPSVAMVAPTSLTFTPTSWNMPQTVTVTAGSDDDTASAMATVTVASQSPALSGTVDVAVTDDDVQELIIASPSVAAQEGQVVTTQVSLRWNPLGNTTVALVSNDSGAVTVSPATLQFTSANYGTPQTVTFAAVQDLDLRDETVDIDVTTAVAPARSVSVTVTDDDVQMILPSATNVAVNEDESTTFTVRLGFDPTNPATVTINTSDAGAATVVPPTLTFTSANYSTPQTVVVLATDDNDVLPETPTLTLTTGGAANVMVSVAVTDPDVQAVVVDPTSLVVNEGGTQSFTARLAFNPVSPASVSLASSDTAVATINNASLMFTSADYAIPRTITVTGVGDADARDETEWITLSTAIAPNAVVGVTVVDDEEQTIVVSVPTLTVTEGASGTFLVSLSADPLTSVQVSLTSANPAVATVSPAALTFTPQNYGAQQMVTVTGEQDDDLASGATTIQLSGADAPDGSVSVSVTDDDEQAFVLTPTSVTFSEDATASFAVALAFRPASATTVTIASMDTGAATVGPPTLTFMPATYALPQTVSVLGAQDDDIIDESVTINVTSAGVTPASLVATVVDDDVPAIVASSTQVTVTEGPAGSGTFTVRLSFAPTGTEVVSLSSADPAIATVTPTTLSFDAMTWSTPQTVTVVGTDDNDALADSTMLTLSSPTAQADLSVSVSVNDDDVQAVLTTASMVALTEGGTETFGVSLAFNPRGPVTVQVGSADVGAATVSPTSLTFDASTYAIVQFVTVTGAQDADVRAESVVITMTTAITPDAAVTANVADDDDPVIIADSTQIAVAEGGTTTLSVNLSYDPVDPVTVSISSADDGAVMTGAATLMFTSANFALPQTVTIQGVQDADAGDEQVVLTLSTAGVPSVTVTVSVDDDEVQAIVAAPSVALTEGGASVTTGVRLAFDPKFDVTVSVESQDSGGASVTPSSLVFTSANWNIDQNVTFTAPVDDDAFDESVAIVLSSPVTADAMIVASVDDVDTQVVLTTPATVSPAEGGTATFDVRLSANPLGTVVVNLSSSDTGAATVGAATLTFTSANYNVNQSVTVTGVHDGDALDESVTLTLSSTIAPAVTVAVSVDDDETQTLVVTPLSLAFGEAGSDTFMVSLMWDPVTTATVTVVSSDEGAATVSSGALFFESGNFATPQTITVSGVQDLDAQHESVTVTVASDVAPSDVSVSVVVTDDDPQAILLTQTMLSLTEGGAAGTFDVTLQADPNGSAVVTVASSDTGAATVSPSMITFTSANYQMPVTVTVSAVQDADAVDESVTVMATSAVASAESVSVSIDDDERWTLTVTNGGNGSVSSDIAGISCGGDCTEPYEDTTVVVLTATPDTGYDFSGWSGDCTGTGTCTVTMTAARNVTATFAIQTPLLTVTNGGNGTITSSPMGIACGGDCTESFDYNTVVTLTPTPATGYSFGGWTGACTGTGACMVTMTQAATVNATFTINRYTLTTVLVGSGVISSVPSGIACNSDCTEDYDYNTMVTLSAGPTSGWQFSGWSGGGCSGTGSCVVTMTQATSVTGTFTQPTLTVSKNGAGAVTSSPAGISCGLTCSADFALNSMVTLTPIPNAGNAFSSWSGDCTGSGACVVTMSQSRSVTANFVATYTLTVTNGGGGLVTSSPAGISCGGDCTEDYADGTMVTLTATPDANFQFGGWSGACSGTGACVVTMDQVRNVSAGFVALYTLDVTVSGNGSVTSSPVGISCNGDCTEDYTDGTMVTLTATPDMGNALSAWSGACSGTGACVVTMDQARSVTATFMVFGPSHALTVTKTGQGTVTSAPAGVNCGATCSASFAENTMVTLTATPVAGYGFAGWTNGCTGATCVVTMSQARSVHAKFELGLIGWWPLDGNATDASGGGLNGTVNGAVATVDRNAMANNALSFDGTEDFVRIPDNSVFDVPGRFSVGLWVRPGSLSGVQYLFGGDHNGPGGNDCYSIRLDGPTLSFRVHDTAGPVHIAGGGDLSPNVWHFIVGTYDKDAAAPQVRIYVDGDLAGSASYAGDVNAIDHDIVFGGTLCNDGNCGGSISGDFVGVIDDVRMWDRALSVSEIQRRVDRRGLAFTETGEYGAYDRPRPVDVDGDGDIDLVAPNGTSIAILSNDGTGVFTLSTFSAAASMTRLQVGDLDGDGDADIIHNRNNAGGADIFLNDGAGGFTDSGVDIGGGSRSEYEFFDITLLDIDNDDDQDIVTSGDGGIHVFKNNGGMSFSQFTNPIVATGGVHCQHSFPDLDGDGDPDIVCVAKTRAWVFDNDGTGDFTDTSSQHTLPAVPDGGGAAAGDLDGDGDDDVVIGVGTTYVLENNAGILTTKAQTYSGYRVSLADLDNDGDLDMLAAAGGVVVDLRVYYNSGDATFVVGPVLASGEGIVLDGDGDGDVDIFSAYSILSSSYYKNTGGLHGWSAVTALPQARGAHGVAQYNGYIYALGGQRPSAGSTSNSVEYARADRFGVLGSWASTTDLPSATDNNAATAFAGYLYTGRSPMWSAPIGANGALGSFTDRGNLPCTVEGLQLVAYNNNLYVLGNCAPTSNYAPISGGGAIGSWQTTTSFANPRTQFAAWAYNGYMYIAGGNNGATRYDDVQSAVINADGSLGAWSVVATLPSARSSVRATTANGFVYISGGDEGAAQIDQVLAAELLPNGRLGPLRISMPLPTVHYNHGMAAVGPYIYVVGGEAHASSGTTVLRARTPGPTGMMRVPAGSFVMGSPSGEAARYVGDEDQHSVTITRPFWMSEVEVTQAEFTRLIGTSPFSFPGCGTDCTGTGLTWFEAVQYANALSLEEGLTPCYTGTSPNYTFTGLDCAGYRLPTSAEYEYAQRAGTTTAFYHGPYTGSGCAVDSGVAGLAVYCANSGVSYSPCNDLSSRGGDVCSGTMVGATRAANDWGLYDMSGNAYSWVWDYYMANYPSVSPAVDPLGPASGTTRVIRGGSWDSPLGDVRSARHGNFSPGTRSSAIGIRLARTDTTPTDSEAPCIGKWLTTTALPRTSTELLAGVSGGFMYAAAVGTGDGASQSSSVYYAPINGDGTLGSWTQTSSFVQPRDGNSGALVVDGYFYVGPGSLGNSQSTNNFDVATISGGGGLGTFAATSAIPQPGDFAGIVAHNGWMISSGGAYSSVFDEVFYAPINGNGTLGSFVATTALPGPRAAHGAVVSGDNLYVLGGTNYSSYFSQVWMAPINAGGGVGAWSTLDPLPGNVAFQGVVAFNSKIAAVGGWTGSMSLASVLVTRVMPNGTLGDWAFDTPLPQTRYRAGVAINNGFVYALGGQGSGGGTTTAYYAPIVCQ